ncbi:DUF92 domain-containing protein [Candidatus Villigracilis affinis]|uniref:DUF92 domain-containing protein n=1 Tax=Candidatus Villigracilis affinis TaxID=3140682 RepID=UPI001E058636|nr:DUF92 domain-containing protein [Anaerolineales bacterium]
MQLLLGFLLAILIAFLAYKARSLNQSGAIAAAFTGTIIFGIGGWQWAVLLLTFFITSSVLSRAFKKRKQGLDEKFSKGHERDAGQVFGNGGVATLFAALHFFFPESSLPWVGFAAALAAVNADTWATELGVLNPNPPRMITNLRKVVEKGTSGGISLIGTLASLTGSALIAVLASLLTDNWFLLPLITISGLAGSLVDSLLGGTVQAMYYCPTDKKETEKHPLHTCGTPTVHIRGWKWLDNDWVNFACGAAGTLVSLLLFLF